MKQKIGLPRMVVIMWCVTAIVAVTFLHMHYHVTSPYITGGAMGAIAGLGGWDVYHHRSIFDGA